MIRVGIILGYRIAYNYEKHLESWKKGEAHAVQLAGNPEEVWMVGDNPVADVGGAEAVGIKAILVRKQKAEPVRYYSPDLRGVIKHIVPSLI